LTIELAVPVLFKGQKRIYEVDRGVSGSMEGSS
jgi:hypothetical protein